MKTIKTTIISAGLLLSTPVFADGGVDVAGNFAVLFDVAALVAFVIGFCLVGTGMYSLYTWGKGHSQKTAGSAILTMLIGTVLSSVGWAYQLMKGSIIGDSTDGVTIESGGSFNLALDSAAASASAAIHASGFGKFIPQDTVKVIIAFVFFVGFCAFISGVYSLKDIGDQRGGQHPLLSPTVKIIGGVLCMNITWFGCFVSALLNIPALCSGG